METRYLKELKINPNNPREITEEKFEQLINSLLVFPRMLELRPVVYGSDGVIIGGNMRFRALCAIADMTTDEIRDRIRNHPKGAQFNPEELSSVLELWDRFRENLDVPAKDASDLTDQEIREFIIKDNESYGKWDWDTLADEWDSDELASFDLDVWEEPDDQEKEKKEDPDLSDKVNSAFEVVVSCENERDQERLFNEFKERGLKCRVLTL